MHAKKQEESAVTCSKGATGNARARATGKKQELKRDRQKEA